MNIENENCLMPNPNWLALTKRIILSDYPSGVKFLPMSIRLLENKIGFKLDEDMQNMLQQYMFCSVGDTWFFTEMIATEDTRRKIIQTAEAWLSKYGCFSFTALRQLVAYEIHNLSDDIGAFEVFFLFLAANHLPASLIKTRAWHGIRIARLPSLGVDQAIAEIGYHINEVLDVGGGLVTEAEVLSQIPALDVDFLAAVVKNSLPHIFKAEMNGLACWSHIESLGLPDNFSFQLSETVQLMELLELDISEEALHTALSLVYRINFNQTYHISDRKSFRNMVGQYFSGETPHVWVSGNFVEARS